MHIVFRDLSIHFRDGTVITCTTDDSYDPEDPKVFASGYLTEIICQIKGAMNNRIEIIVISKK
jgi:hypothetical protein